jgi:predicted N-acetyltransferase YhbS
MRTVWPDIDGGRLRAPYPSAVRPTYYTVTEDDLLLSFAATFVTSVELGDTKLSAACLGNVFTFPGDRRRGLGRRVVDAASDDIRRSDVDVGALVCDPELEPFYRSSGWVAMPEAATLTGDGAVLRGLRMVLIVSDAARTCRPRLATQPMLVPAAW